MPRGGYDPTREAPCVVPFAVDGHEHQTLRLEMTRGDRVFCERDALVAYAGDVTVSAVAMTRRGTRWWHALLAPLRWIQQITGRVLSGERAWATHLEAVGEAAVVLANAEGGQLARIPTNGGAVTVARHRWIANTGNLALQLRMLPGVGTTLLTRAHLFWQEVVGDGDVFVGAQGNCYDATLASREDVVVIDPAHLLAWWGDLTFTPKLLTSMRGVLFAGEGLALLAVRGPGHLLLDTGHPRVARTRPRVAAPEAVA